MVKHVAKSAGSAVKRSSRQDPPPKANLKTAKPKLVKAASPRSFDTIELQNRLAKLPVYSDHADGLFGRETREAVQAMLVKSGVQNWSTWSDQRLLTAGKQALCCHDDIDTGAIDGLTGPQTRHAIEVYEARLNGNAEPETWRDKAAPSSTPDTIAANAQNWPRQRDSRAFFGNPGANQTRLSLPYPMRLAWDTDTIVRSTMCHEKVHDAAGRVLLRALDHYGEAEIRALGLDLFGGCLNVRKMRGGRAWSMHSWGIAFDFDPARNQLRWGKDKAAFAKPAYTKWFDLWEEEGALSLGRARNFDWMHIQFARL